MITIALKGSIEDLTRRALQRFEERAAAKHADPCWNFNCEVKELLGSTNTLFALVARAAKNLEQTDLDSELKQVADFWHIMEQACDVFLAKVVELSERYTHCPSELYTNELLDIRNACQRRKELHQ
jgi:hypothetical protein